MTLRKNVCKREPLSKLVDFPNFPKTHPLYDNSRRGQLGLLKSEVGDREIMEVIVLQAKSYSVQLADHSNIKRLKCIPRSKQTGVDHDDYCRVLFDEKKTPWKKMCVLHYT